MRYALSIRGGGIRGIIPCCCLVKLEQQLGGLTRDHIDFCAGTSTGALLTASVAAGIPAADALKVYTERSGEIFTPTGFLASVKRFTSGYMYDPKHLRDVLVSVLGPNASWKVNDSPLRVLLCATATNGHNWFFVRDNPKNAGTTGSVKLIDAAVASACAPTYFNYWPIDGIEGKKMYFYDGGAGGTADPLYQCCVEAFEYDDFTPAATRIVSLGTGYFPGGDAPPSGILGTVSWATGTLVDTSEDWVDKAVQRQWPDIVTTFNPLLPKAIDEADLGAIPALLDVGQKLADTIDWRQLLAGGQHATV